MTTAQIKYIVETILGDSVDTYTTLSNAFAIDIEKGIRIVPMDDLYRVKFNTKMELLEKINVRVYSHDASIVPSHDNYDIVVDNKTNTTTVYEYVMKNGKILTDYFMFDKINSFVPKIDKVEVSSL